MVKLGAETSRKAERTLLRPTIVGLLRLGWLNQMTLADTEIPWHQKRVDFGFISRSEDVRTVAIELKVDSTSRAIEQAELNRYLTPSSWVATWTLPRSSMLAKAERAGVGMMIVVEPRGVYPIAYPRVGRPYTTAFVDHLQVRRRRVRDVLSELRNA